MLPWKSYKNHRLFPIFWKSYPLTLENCSSIFIHIPNQFYHVEFYVPCGKSWRLDSEVNLLTIATCSPWKKLYTLFWPRRTAVVETRSRIARGFAKPIMSYLHYLHVFLVHCGLCHMFISLATFCHVFANARDRKQRKRCAPPACREMLGHVFVWHVHGKAFFPKR